MEYCPSCKKHTYHSERENWGLYLVLTVLTIGFWLMLKNDVTDIEINQKNCDECSRSTGWGQIAVALLIGFIIWVPLIMVFTKN